MLPPPARRYSCLWEAQFQVHLLLRRIRHGLLMATCEHLPPGVSERQHIPSDAQATNSLWDYTHVVSVGSACWASRWLPVQPGRVVPAAAGHLLRSGTWVATCSAGCQNHRHRVSTCPTQVMNWVISKRKGADRNEDWLKYFDVVRCCCLHYSIVGLGLAVCDRQENWIQHCRWMWCGSGAVRACTGCTGRAVKASATCEPAACRTSAVSGRSLALGPVPSPAGTKRLALPFPLVQNQGSPLTSGTPIQSALPRCRWWWAAPSPASSTSRATCLKCTRG